MTPTLEEQIVALGPWCHEIQVTPRVSTRVWYERAPDEEAELPFVNPNDIPAGRLLRRLFPGGLDGRSVLDCGCNGGGYLFMARDLGAGRCYGFDARDHWVRQAQFVAAHREGSEDITFEVRSLDDLPRLEHEKYDVTFFNGILYHLPEPVGGLKIASDLTQELIIVDTSTRAGMPDGYLAVQNEDKELLLAGVHGLSWLPTGPAVVHRMLRWAGFIECVTVQHLPVRPEVSRLVVAASKATGLLAPLREA